MKIIIMLLFIVAIMISCGEIKCDIGCVKYSQYASYYGFDLDAAKQQCQADYDCKTDGGYSEAPCNCFFVDKDVEPDLIDPNLNQY